MEGTGGSEERGPSLPAFLHGHIDTESWLKLRWSFRDLVITKNCDSDRWNECKNEAKTFESERQKLEEQMKKLKEDWESSKETVSRLELELKTVKTELQTMEVEKNEALKSLEQVRENLNAERSTSSRAITSAKDEAQRLEMLTLRFKAFILDANSAVRKYSDDELDKKADIPQDMLTTLGDSLKSSLEAGEKNRKLLEKKYEEAKQSVAEAKKSVTNFWLDGDEDPRFAEGSLPGGSSNMAGCSHSSSDLPPPRESPTQSVVGQSDVQTPVEGFNNSSPADPRLGENATGDGGQLEESMELRFGSEQAPGFGREFVPGGGSELVTITGPGGELLQIQFLSETGEPIGSGNGEGIGSGIGDESMPPAGAQISEVSGSENFPTANVIPVLSQPSIEMKSSNGKFRRERPEKYTKPGKKAGSNGTKRNVRKKKISPLPLRPPSSTIHRKSPCRLCTCGAILCSKRSLQRHLDSNNLRNIYGCLYCSNSYVVYERMKEHVGRDHKSEEYDGSVKCAHCKDDKIYCSKQLLQKHGYQKHAN